eukprot:2051976-Pleurochrysis_carterae.AAC.1
MLLAETTLTALTGQHYPGGRPDEARWAHSKFSSSVQNELATSYALVDVIEGRNATGPMRCVCPISMVRQRDSYADQVNAETSTTVQLGTHLRRRTESW